MKEILIFLMICSFNITTFSQTIDDVDIREMKSEFVDVETRGVPKFNSGWLPIKVNYGVGETIKK